MANVKITVDRKAQIFVEELRKGLKKATPKALGLYGGRLINRIKQEVRAFADNPSGKLEKSFSQRIRRDGELGSMSIISDAPHATIHEHGGDILPKRGRALTIPLTPMARKFKARYFPGNLIAFKSRSGKALLGRRMPGGRLEPQFLLARRARIRPKRYLSKAMTKSVGDAEKTFGGMAIAVTESARRAANTKGARRIEV